MSSEQEDKTMISSATKDNISGKPVKRVTMKSKFSAIYESLLNGENQYLSNSNFWDELFLFKVNKQFLTQSLILKKPNEIIKISSSIQLIFYHACEILDVNDPIRTFNALQTMCIFLSAIFKKNFENDNSKILLNLICNEENVNTFFVNMFKKLEQLLLTESISYDIKCSAIELILRFVTSHEVVNSNIFLEQIMSLDLFDSFLRFLNIAANINDKQALSDIFVILSVLSYYKTENDGNIYIKRLSSLQNEHLKELTDILLKVCTDICEEEYLSSNSSPSSSWFGFIFNSQNQSNSEDKKKSISCLTGSFLLFFYRLNYLCPEFLSYACSLTSQAQLKSPTSSSNSKTALESKILTRLFELSYVLISETQNFNYKCYNELYLIIFMIISENKEVINMLYHSNQIMLFYDLSNNRKPKLDNTLKPMSLACWLVELLQRYIRINMKKNFNTEIYLLCFSVLHRILCFQKRMRIKMPYKWKSIWISIIKFCKFISTSNNGVFICSGKDLISLSKSISQILNMFITFGDNFLPETSDYDDLFYDLIRNERELNEFILHVESIDTKKEVYQDLYNLKTILSHFSEKIEHYQMINPNTIISDKIVLDVIKSNYETLKLKLQNNLDKYQPYKEDPTYVLFFNHIIRNIISDVKFVKDQYLLKEIKI